MLPGTVFLGFYDAFTRKLLKSGVHEGLLLGLTFTFSGLIFFLMLLVLGFPIIHSEFYPAFIGTVALNFVSQGLWYKAFKYDEASLIAPLRLLTPPFVLLTGFLTLKEVPSWGGTVGVLTTILGLWFLMRGEAAHTDGGWYKVFGRPGVRYGLIGAFLFALSFPLDKQAVINSSGLFFSFSAFLLIGLSTLIQTYFLNRKNKNIYKSVRPVLKYLPWHILIFSAGGFLALQSLNYAFAAYAASVKRLWSLWAVIFSGSLLREKNIYQKLLATLIMIVGVVITVVYGN